MLSEQQIMKKYIQSLGNRVICGKKQTLKERLLLGNHKKQFLYITKKIRSHIYQNKMQYTYLLM